VAGGLAIATNLLPLKMGLVLAAILGALSGWLWDRRQSQQRAAGVQV
jgi:hypothetical protein